MFYLALLLLVAAIGVVLVEFFVPSAGVLGIVAALLWAAAIYFGFQDSLASGALIMALGVIAIPMLLYGWVKVWPYTPLGRRILLDDLTTEDVMPKGSHYEKTSGLKGQLGVARSKMLPSGQVVIDGLKYDAVSEGFAIEAGDPVIVSDVRGNRIYVEPYDGDPDQLPARDRNVFDQPIEDLGIDPIDDPLE